MILSRFDRSLLNCAVVPSPSVGVAEEMSLLMALSGLEERFRFPVTVEESEDKGVACIVSPFMVVITEFLCLIAAKDL